MNIQVGRLPVEPSAGLLEDRLHREGSCETACDLPFGVASVRRFLNAPGVRDWMIHARSGLHWCLAVLAVPERFSGTWLRAQVLAGATVPGARSRGSDRRG
jgi:hypothetical protein